MQNLVDAIDILQQALKTETVLRQAANAEWTTGNHNGPMKIAHDAAIQQIILASKNLVMLSGI
jgi:hypothetical protein